MNFRRAPRRRGCRRHGQREPLRDTQPRCREAAHVRGGARPTADVRGSVREKREESAIAGYELPRRVRRLRREGTLGLLAGRHRRRRFRGSATRRRPPRAARSATGRWYSPSRCGYRGRYEVGHTFTDPNPENGKEVSTTRTVRVIDKPSIALNGAGFTVNVTKGDRWSLPVADEYVVADDAAPNTSAARVVRVTATPSHPRYASSAGNSNATFDEINIYTVATSRL